MTAIASLDFAPVHTIRQPLPGGSAMADIEDGKDDRPRALLICRDGLGVPDLAGYLRDSGFAVDEQDALSLATSGDVDAVILVATLGEAAVFEFLRDSALAAMPVIVLSQPAEAVVRVLALELGAADVIDQETSFREVLARLRALLRVRAPTPRRRDARAGRGEVWTLDARARCLQTPAGTVLRLGAGEFELLAAFEASAGEVLDYGHIPERRRMAVSRFGRRLKRELGLDSPIENVRGRGYCFRSELRIR